MDFFVLCFILFICVFVFASEHSSRFCILYVLKVRYGYWLAGKVKLSEAKFVFADLKMILRWPYSEHLKRNDSATVK